MHNKSSGGILGGAGVQKVSRRIELEQVGRTEVVARVIQVAMFDAKFSQKKHENELTFVFDKLSMFQEGVLQNIHTLTERLDNM